MHTKNKLVPLQLGEPQNPGPQLTTKNCTCKWINLAHILDVLEAEQTGNQGTEMHIVICWKMCSVSSSQYLPWQFCI